MRRSVAFVVMVGIGLVGMLCPASAQTLLKLEDGWRIQSAAEAGVKGRRLSKPGYVTAGWHPATVPTTVLAALVADGTYPDPYYGNNLKSIPGYHDEDLLLMPEDSPFRSSWWYRTEFEIPAVCEGQRISLHLDGVNYQANVWMNGKRIAGEDDVIAMFRRFTFDVTDVARAGERNALAVECIPPGLFGEMPYRTKQLEATTGWDDHNPLPPDMNLGLWEDVYIRATGPVVLKHPYVASDLEVPGLDKARLTVSVYAENLSDSQRAVHVFGSIEDIAFSRDVMLDAGETRLVTFAPEDCPQLGVENPRVWWPNPVGPQELYDLQLTATVGDAVSDTAGTRFGIRHITSVINEEGWRRFRVNGRDILIRGGAWMTSDMLLRFSHRRYDALIRYAREANLNMLRSEGFSIRETDEFYSLCDEYGVMVTQQIFGRSIPREDLAIACTEDTILRIRNHPSLVHFLGHDETFPTETLDAAYRGLLAKHTPDRTYQPHSGAFDVKHRFKTGGTRTGTRELWTYANPKHYYEQREDGAWGFAQSGGIGGIVAPFESVRRFIPEGQRWPLWTDALSFHTVTQGGEFFDTVVQMLGARYGKADSLEEFCMKAQALNYECSRGMFEAYGRNKYSATGITTWKYDAAWPAFMTWHYVDWNLIANGGYYGAKKACEALHVQYSYDDHSVYVVNGLYESFGGLKVSAKVLNLDGSEQYSRSASVDVTADGKVNAFTVAWPEGLTKSHFLRLTLEDADGEHIDENFYWLSTAPDVRGTMNRSWREFSVMPKSIADHTDLNTLPDVALEVSAAFEEADDETMARVTVANPGDHVAFLIRLSLLAGEGGDEISPAFWDDNYISLLPGESRTVTGTVYARDLAEAKPVVVADGWNAPRTVAQ